MLNFINAISNAISYDKILKKNEISDKEIFPEREEDIKYILKFIENKDNKNITFSGCTTSYFWIFTHLLAVQIPHVGGKAGAAKQTLMPHQNRENDVGQARKRPE